MAQNNWLPEAQALNAYCAEREGDTLAMVDYLDRDPVARLSLEYTLPGRGGMVLEEVEDYTRDDVLPYHIRAYRGRFLRLVPKANKMVFDLLLILKDLYGSPGATTEAGLRAALVWLEKAIAREEGEDAPVKALMKMTVYFRDLVQALPEVNEGGDTLQLRSDEELTRTMNYWVHTPMDDTGSASPYRHRCIHAPGAPIIKDWILRQSVQFKSLFYGMRKARNSKTLNNFRQTLLKITNEEKMSRICQKVLWEQYRTTRDRIRKVEKQLAAKRLGETAERIINRLNKLEHLGKTGVALFNWCKGEKFNDRPCPGPVKPGEWAIIWDVYRSKKAELAEAYREQQLFDAGLC